MPGLVDEWTWTQKQGDGVNFTVAYQEDNGDPIDITGWSPELSVGRARGKPHIKRWTSSPEIVITDAENGVLTITLTPDDTREWMRSRDLVYEITLTPPGGQTITILEGPLVVRLEVGDE